MRARFGHLLAVVLLAVAITSCGEEPRDDATRVPPSRATSTTTPAGGLSKGVPPFSPGPAVTSQAPGERPPTGTSPKQTNPKKPTSSPPGGGANPCGTPPAGRAPDGRSLQGIVFPDPGSHQWPDNELTLRACATSGLPVVYEFEDGGRGRSCHVFDPAAVPVKGQGDILSCWITATQPGNATFAPAEPVTVMWVVGKLVVKIGWLGSGETLVYSPSAPSVSLQARVTAIHPIPYLQLSGDATGACTISKKPSAFGETGQKDITIDVEIGLTDPGAQGAACDLRITVGANQITDGSSSYRHYTVTSS